MKDKKLLSILFLLAIYVFLANPLISRMDEKVIELRRIERLIAKEKFIQSQAKKINDIYPREKKIIELNKKMFFSDKLSTSSAMGNMQSVIKSFAKENSLQVLSINWADPEEKDGYIKLPISFTVKGYPDGIFNFTKEILSFKKLMRFSVYSISRYRDKLILKAIIVGFKLKGLKKKNVE